MSNPAAGLDGVRGHLGARRRIYGSTLLVGVLVLVNLQIRENFPFSHFPMFARPGPHPVDYYFLTDGQGAPLATRHVAGITTPAIKKILAHAVAAERRERGTTATGVSDESLQRAAAAVLVKLRADALHMQRPLTPWPAEVQLRQGLIETTPLGFRESFRTVATLLAPDRRSSPPPNALDDRPRDATTPEATGTVGVFARCYLGALAALIALLLGWGHLPNWAREWLACGTGAIAVGRLEAFCLRAGLAFVLWQALQVSVDFDSLPYPQGLARLEWLRPALIWLGHPENWRLVLQAAMPLLFWYVCGWAQFIPLTILTLAHILLRTLFASQGMTHHGHQLLSLVFCAQTVVAWAIVAARVRGTTRPALRPGNHTVIWHAVVVVIAAAYVTGAAQKLIASEGRWLLTSHHLSAQIVKTTRQSYYDGLDPQYLIGTAAALPAPMDQADPSNDRYRHPIPVAAQWVRSHPHLARVLFAFGFCVEVLALLAVRSRQLATLCGLALISFHGLVLWLMRLSFPLNVETVWVVLVNVPGWLIWWHVAQRGHPRAASTRRMR
ncbi:MAG: hypothetical protein ACRERC_15545 [Candidatus Binatia bacterium]